MTDLNRSMPRVDASHFALVPRADIPRSTFETRHSVKTTFNAGTIVPIWVEEVLPADVHQCEITIFARLATLLFPLMDNIELETFAFFVPNRILWTNWKKMMGERTNPADSISYTTPQHGLPNGQVTVGSIYDYMGAGTPGTDYNTFSVNALPFRAYYKIFNDWFRDQNLDNSLTEYTNDGPDPQGAYALQTRRKKHDYFTSALPWPLKGGVEIALPFTGTANVIGLATSVSADPTDGNPGSAIMTGGTSVTGWAGYFDTSTAARVYIRQSSAAAGGSPMVYADLATNAGITINSLRLAVQTQRLLERDARSGTRYTELLRAHFGVTPEDARLQRPEYIGGGRTSFQTQAIPQTSATGLTGGSSPLGALGAAAITTDRHSYRYHATEHGFILVLACVRGELTYQQGLHRMWTRMTRYDHYLPVFAHLGEQAIRNDEIYYVANAGQNAATFGYQERWAEYRHRASRVSGLFRSTAGGNIDEWHLAEQFSSLPALNNTFMADPTQATLQRALAAGAAEVNKQILFDSVFHTKTTRAMPMFSVPGMMDRF